MMIQKVTYPVRAAEHVKYEYFILDMMIQKVTYPVRAAEHVKYEYFILDMMIHENALLQYMVYLIFGIIVSQPFVCIFK